MQLLFQKIFLLCRLTRFAGRVGWDSVSGYESEPDHVTLG